MTHLIESWGKEIIKRGRDILERPQKPIKYVRSQRLEKKTTTAIVWYFLPPTKKESCGEERVLKIDINTQIQLKSSIEYF